MRKAFFTFIRKKSIILILSFSLTNRKRKVIYFIIQLQPILLMIAFFCVPNFFMEYGIPEYLEYQVLVTENFMISSPFEGLPEARDRRIL